MPSHEIFTTRTFSSTLFLFCRDISVRGPGGHDAGALFWSLPPHLIQQAEGVSLAVHHPPGPRHVLRYLHHAHHRSVRARSQGGVRRSLIVFNRLTRDYYMQLSL